MLAAEGTDIVRWLPVIASLIITGGALAGIPLAHRYQAQREHQRWLSDRRLEAYATLSTATFGLGHSTETKGQLASLYRPDPAWAEAFSNAQSEWEKWNDAAVEAQSRALLISDSDIYSLIVKMNHVLGAMVDESVNASPRFDEAGKMVDKPSDEATARLQALSTELIALRSKFLEAARTSVGAVAK